MPSVCTSVKTVGISEMKVTNDPNDVLVTYSLGSCLGVSLYDPVHKIGGLIHCMLPLSKSNPEKAKNTPAMYVDTGMVQLLQAVLDLGADKSKMKVFVAGGAAPLDKCGRFAIGEKNFTVFRKILWKNSLMIEGEDVGGSQPRTMTLYMADGRSTVKVGGVENAL